jgi:hypothetical protein
MKYSSFILLVSFLFLSSCNKESLSFNDPLFDDQQIEDLFDSEINLNESQGLRNGTQKINVNQTDARLIRGTEVRIPVFASEREPVNVPVGSWITISFTLQDVVNEGPCEAPLTEEQISTYMTDAASFVEEFGLEISFDGEEIELVSNLRDDEIITVINNDGDCQYILPFRYYVNPQSKGSHTLGTVYDGVEYERTVTWVAGKKKGK